MLNAIETKLIAYRKKSYFNIVEDKILNSAKDGELSCVITLDEIPEGTTGKLDEISYLLIELGYQSIVEENKLSICWAAQKPFYEIMDVLGEEDDDSW